MSNMIVDKINSRVPSGISDPFKCDFIEGIHLHAFKGVFGDICIRGTVEFKNGRTKGEQQFEADTLAGLYNKVWDFCNSLQ